MATAGDVGTGASDARSFIHAMRAGLVILTRNYEDFRELHEVVEAAQGTHPGILVARSDNDPRRDMTPRGIVTAIGNLQLSGAPVRDQFHVLNHWR